MAGNLRGGYNMVFLENNPSIRGCLTSRAREIVDSGKLYVINSNVGSSSSYLSNGSEMLNNNNSIIRYHRTDSSPNTVVEVKSTAEETAQSQRMQEIDSVDDMTYTINGQKYIFVYDEFGNEYWLPKGRYDEIASNLD